MGVFEPVRSSRSTGMRARRCKSGERQPPLFQWDGERQPPLFQWDGEREPPLA
jgi:hypothetical protein